MDTETRAKTLDEFEREEAEAAVGGKKRKQKPEKAPKQAKKKPEKPPKAPKANKAGKKEAVAEASGADEAGLGRKRHPARNAMLLTSLFWMLLIGFVIVVCWSYEDGYGETKYLADPEGVIRGPILLFLTRDESREVYYSAEYDEINDLITQREEELAELEIRAEELDFREEELDEWEARLEELEELLGESMPEYGDGTAAPVTADIATLAKAWSEMTPAKAAAAIEEMSDDAVTLKVLRLVKYKSLGKILDAMSAEEAARISELLAEPPDIE